MTADGKDPEAFVKARTEARAEEQEAFEEMKKKLRAQFGHEPSNADVRWGLLNQEALQTAAEGLFGYHRNVRFEMAEQLQVEGKLKSALSFYAQVLYLDALGPTNSQSNPLNPIHAFFASGILKRVVKLKKKNKISRDDWRELFLKTISDRFSLIEAPSVSPEDGYGLVEEAITLMAEGREEEAVKLPGNLLANN